MIAGTSAYDQYWLRHDQAIFDQLTARVRFRYLSDLPMLDLLREVRHLKPHAIIFVHALGRDAAGEEFSDSEMLDLITKNSNAPVYGLTTAIGIEGLVGGRPSGDDDRRFPMAFEIVRRVLTGEEVSDIPIEKAKAEYPYIFDARQLRRWNIDFDRVPSGSLLLHQEPSFLQLHKNLAMSVSSFVAAGECAGRDPFDAAGSAEESRSHAGRSQRAIAGIRAVLASLERATHLSSGRRTQADCP